MADSFPSLFDDPVEELDPVGEPDPEEQAPDQLDSLIHRLTTPVKRENATTNIDLEQNGDGGMPDMEELNGSMPVTEELNVCVPVTEELDGSVPVARAEENNDTLPMVEEKNDSLPMVEENNVSKHEEGETNTLRLVLPGESGEGLPYAPENWPNPGDNWKWRVGQRYNAAGYFMDRFLYLPTRLQKTPTSKQMFASKPTVEKYIRSTLPDASVDEFFASFSWKVPVKRQSSTAVAASLPQEGITVNEVEEGNAAEKQNLSSESQRKAPRAKRQRTETPASSTPLLSQREKRPRAAAPSSFKPKKQERYVEETPKPPSRKKQEKVVEEKPQSSTHKRGSSKSSRLFTATTSNDNENQEQTIPEEPVFELPPIPPDFDNYLNNLDDILTQPLSVIPPPHSKPADVPAIEDEMTEARNKLSALLMMDFPTLVSSNHYPELVTLATKLHKDPRLTAEQLVKLKLIEEIPSFSTVFVESSDIINEVNGLFANLEGNKSKVSSLRNEYNELKEKADQLQAQVDSNTVAVQEIDNQIAQLQAWRAELVGKIESNKAAKEEVLHSQKIVANGIPSLVQEIQVSNAKILDWELRKSNAERRVGEIITRFAPLQGFSL